MNIQASIHKRVTFNNVKTHVMASNRNVIKIARRTKNDIDKQLDQKIQYAELHCVQNKNHDCYIIWSDVKRLYNKSKSLGIWIETMDELSEFIEDE
jgi:hypothetical protein